MRTKSKVRKWMDNIIVNVGACGLVGLFFLFLVCGPALISAVVILFVVKWLFF